MQLIETVKFKQTEAGLIPLDWKIKKICEIARTEGGYAFKSSKFSDSGTYQIIKMSNVYGGNLNLNRSKSFLNTIDLTEQNYLLKDGDILITLTGTTGKRDYGYTFIIKNQKNLLLNQRVARIVSDENTHPEYIFYQLRMPAFFNQFFELSKGGTGNQTNVGTKDVDEIKIPVPTLSEQKAIATALSDVDALITHLENLITKKKAMKQGAMQELLTGKTRLAGFEKKKGYKQTEIGMIPVDWKLEQIGDRIDLLTGFPFPSSKYSTDGIRLLKGMNIKRGNTSWGKNTTFWNDEISKYKQFQLNEGDLVIAMDGSLVGRSYAYITKDDLPALLLQRVARIRSKGIDTNYLRFFVGSEWFIEHCDSVKTVTAIPHISPKDIRQFSIPIPPSIEEQKAIATILSDIDIEIVKLESKKSKYQQIKHGMMQELLTGKTRLI